jgi:hypothetical protein
VAEAGGKDSQAIERYHNLIMIGFRFLYGMRIMTPFVIAMCENIKASRFTTLNTMGSALVGNRRFGRIFLRPCRGRLSQKCKTV